MVMRIAFVGPHNAGKDTLSHHAFTHLKLRKQTVAYIDEQAALGISRSIDLSKPAGQWWLLGEQIAAETELMNWSKRDFVVCNRGVIDNIAYSQHYQDYGTATRIHDCALSFMRQWPYDLVIYLRPLPDLEDDGVRMTDRQDQLKLDQVFKTTLRKLEQNGIVKQCIPIDSPTKEERAKLVELAIDLFLAEIANSAGDKAKFMRLAMRHWHKLNTMPQSSASRFTKLQ